MYVRWMPIICSLLLINVAVTLCGQWSPFSSLWGSRRNQMTSSHNEITVFIQPVAHLWASPQRENTVPDQLPCCLLRLASWRWHSVGVCYLSVAHTVTSRNYGNTDTAPSTLTCRGCSILREVLCWHCRIGTVITSWLTCCGSPNTRKESSPALSSCFWIEQMFLLMEFWEVPFWVPLTPDC